MLISFFQMTTLTPKKIIPPKEDRSVSKKTFNFSQSLKAWMFFSMQLRLVSSSWRSYFVPLLWAPLVRETLTRGFFLGGGLAMAKVGFSKRVGQIGVIIFPHFCGRIKQYKSMAILREKSLTTMDCDPAGNDS